MDPAKGGRRSVTESHPSSFRALVYPAGRGISEAFAKKGQGKDAKILTAE